jgi:hypothetical protein
VVGDETIDRMITDTKETGIPLLDGPDGLVGQLTALAADRWRTPTSVDAYGYPLPKRPGCPGSTSTICGTPAISSSPTRARTLANS